MAWSIYPNGLDPAPVAAAVDTTPPGGGVTWIARVRPVTAVSWRRLKVLEIGGVACRSRRSSCRGTSSRAPPASSRRPRSSPTGAVGSGCRGSTARAAGSSASLQVGVPSISPRADGRPASRAASKVPSHAAQNLEDDARLLRRILGALRGGARGESPGRLPRPPSTISRGGSGRALRRRQQSRPSGARRTGTGLLARADRAGSLLRRRASTSRRGCWRRRAGAWRRRARGQHHPHPFLRRRQLRRHRAPSRSFTLVREIGRAQPMMVRHPRRRDTSSPSFTIRSALGRSSSGIGPARGASRPSPTRAASMRASTRSWIVPRGILPPKPLAGTRRAGCASADALAGGALMRVPRGARRAAGPRARLAEHARRLLRGLLRRGAEEERYRLSEQPTRKGQAP